MANIIKAEKATLAKLDTGRLAKRIDKYVATAFTEADSAAELYAVAKHRLEDYKGEDSAVRSKLEEVVKQTRLARNDAFASIEDYIQEQMALFRSRGLEPTRALKEAIVPTGETLPNGKEIFRIVKRGLTLEEVDESDGNDGPACSVRASRSYSDRAGLGRDQKRGKYNDADMLIEQSSASVDASEVVPFASACV